MSHLAPKNRSGNKSHWPTIFFPPPNPEPSAEREKDETIDDVSLGGHTTAREAMSVDFSPPFTSILLSIFSFFFFLSLENLQKILSFLRS